MLNLSNLPSGSINLSTVIAPIATVARLALTTSPSAISPHLASLQAIAGDR